MADVIQYPAIRDDAELEIAVAEYLNEKGWADNANARKKARETQIKDYMGMASEKVLSNGIKIRVGMPIIRNSFDVNSFKLAHPAQYKAYMKTSTQDPRLSITMPKAGDK